MKNSPPFFRQPWFLAMSMGTVLLVWVLFLVLGGDKESSSSESRGFSPPLGLKRANSPAPAEPQPGRLESEEPKKERKDRLPIPGLDPDTVESLRADYLALYQKAVEEENHRNDLPKEEFFKNLAGYADKLGPFGHFQAKDFQLGPFFPYNSLQATLLAVEESMESFGENPFQGPPGMVKTYERMDKAFGDFTFRAPPEYQLDRFLEGRSAEWSPDLVQEVHNLWKDFLPRSILFERNQGLMERAIGQSLKNHHLGEAVSWWKGKQTAKGVILFPPDRGKSMEATFPEYRDLTLQGRSQAAEYKRLLLQALQARGYSVNPDWRPTAE